MLVSAVIDPSAFNKDYFGESYRFHAEDFLKGIINNGLLIFDSEGELRKAFIEQIMSLSTPVGQQLQVLLADLLKIEAKRFVACCVSLDDPSSDDLLDMAYRLKMDTYADALIVGEHNLEKLKSDHKHSEEIILLSDYRNSDFEKNRDRYDQQVGPIDTLPKREVKELIIRSIRFAKSLTFYDPYIGGRNIRNFQEGIEYILCLWYKHGFFSSQQGNGSVKIFTRKNPRVRNQHQRIVERLKKPLESKFPWPVQFLIKVDSGPKRIFHARYLETPQAIIQVERGFDLFQQNGAFHVNFFTLSKDSGSLLKRYRELPDADLDNGS